MPWNCLDLTMSQKKAIVPATRSSILPLDCLLSSDVHWLEHSPCVRHMCYHACVSSNCPAADYLRTVMLLNLQKVSCDVFSIPYAIYGQSVLWQDPDFTSDQSSRPNRVYRWHKHFQHVAIITCDVQSHTNFKFQKQHPSKLAYHDMSCSNRKSLQHCLCWHKINIFRSSQAIKQTLKAMKQVYLPCVYLSWVPKSVLIFQESRLRQLELE